MGLKSAIRVRELNGLLHLLKVSRVLVKRHLMTSEKHWFHPRDIWVLVGTSMDLELWVFIRRTCIWDFTFFLVCRCALASVCGWSKPGKSPGQRFRVQSPSMSFSHSQEAQCEAKFGSSQVLSFADAILSWKLAFYKKNKRWKSVLCSMYGTFPTISSKHTNKESPPHVSKYAIPPSHVGK